MYLFDSNSAVCFDLALFYSPLSPHMDSIGSLCKWHGVAGFTSEGFSGKLPLSLALRRLLCSPDDLAELLNMLDPAWLGWWWWWEYVKENWQLDFSIDWAADHGSPWQLWKGVFRWLETFTDPGGGGGWEDITAWLGWGTHWNPFAIKPTKFPWFEGISGLLLLLLPTAPSKEETTGWWNSLFVTWMSSTTGESEVLVSKFILI